MPGTDSAPDPVVAEAAIAEKAISEANEHVEPTKDDLAAFREMYYERHARLQQIQQRGIRRDRQLAFVFALLVLSVVILAYRTESTDAKIRDGFYDACVARNDQSVAINQVRQVFINRIAAGPSGQNADGQIAIAQLQSFLQPLEDCGSNPR